MSGPGGKDARNDNDSAGLSANITTFVPKRPVLASSTVFAGNGSLTVCRHGDEKEARGWQ